MPIPSLQLGTGKLLAVQSSSQAGIEVQTEGWIFAMIDDVYEGSDILTVGNLFLLEQSKAVQIKYGSSIYYYLDAKDAVGFVEIPPP